jgi:hypothetical protein
MAWCGSSRNSRGIGAGGGGIITAGEKGAGPARREGGALAGGGADSGRAREELGTGRIPDTTPATGGRLETGIPDIPVRVDDFGGISVVRSSSIICSRVNTRGRSDGGRGYRPLTDGTGVWPVTTRTTSISPERMSSASSDRRFENGSNGGPPAKGA